MKKVIYHLFCSAMVFVFSTACADEVIKVAGIYELTGATVSGNETLQGIRLGIDEVNRRGGVLGKKMKLIVLDNLSTPIGSNVAAEEADKLNVAAIIGPAWSSHAIAVAKVAQAKKIPMISNVATNPKITKIGNHIFRVCFTDAFQGRVMAEFAHKYLKADTAVIFSDITSDYSMVLAEMFRTNFESLGGRILLALKYKHKHENHNNLIAQAKKTDSDVLFISGHSESGQIVKDAQDAGISAIPLGGDGWDVENFFSRGGKYLKQGYYCTHWSKAMDSELSGLFVKKYKHTGNISSATVLAYDAVLLLADAIGRAGSADRAGIRNAIANTRGFKGVTGTISFDMNGDPIKSAVIMEIKNGKLGYLKTVAP